MCYGIFPYMFPDGDDNSGGGEGSTVMAKYIGELDLTPVYTLSDGDINDTTACTVALNVSNEQVITPSVVLSPYPISSALGYFNGSAANLTRLVINDVTSYSGYFYWPDITVDPISYLFFTVSDQASDPIVLAMRLAGGGSSVVNGCGIAFAQQGGVPTLSLTSKVSGANSAEFQPFTPPNVGDKIDVNFSINTGTLTLSCDNTGYLAQLADFPIGDIDPVSDIKLNFTYLTFGSSTNFAGFVVDVSSDYASSIGFKRAVADPIALPSNTNDGDWAKASHSGIYGNKMITAGDYFVLLQNKTMAVVVREPSGIPLTDARVQEIALQITEQEITAALQVGGIINAALQSLPTGIDLSEVWNANGYLAEYSNTQPVISCEHNPITGLVTSENSSLTLLPDGAYTQSPDLFPHAGFPDRYFSMMQESGFLLDDDNYQDKRFTFSDPTGSSHFQEYVMVAVSNHPTTDPFNVSNSIVLAFGFFEYAYRAVVVNDSEEFFYYFGGIYRISFDYPNNQVLISVVSGADVDSPSTVIAAISSPSVDLTQPLTFSIAKVTSNASSFNEFNVFHHKETVISEYPFNAVEGRKTYRVYGTNEHSVFNGFKLQDNDFVSFYYDNSSFPPLLSGLINRLYSPDDIKTIAKAPDPSIEKRIFNNVANADAFDAFLGEYDALNGVYIVNAEHLVDCTTVTLATVRLRLHIQDYVSDMSAFNEGDIFKVALYSNQDFNLEIYDQDNQLINTTAINIGQTILMFLVAKYSNTTDKVIKLISKSFI